MIATLPPYPPNSGGRQRTNLMYQALSECGHVDLLLIFFPALITPDQIEYAKKHFNLVAFIPLKIYRERWPIPMRIFPWLLKDRIRPLLERNKSKYLPHPFAQMYLDKLLGRHHYDVIVGRYLLPFCKANAFRYRPLILDVDDIDFMLYHTQSKMPGISWPERIILDKKRQQAEQATRHKLMHCEHLWFSSESDKTLIGLDNSSALPNIPFIAYKDYSIAPHQQWTLGSKVILIVGDTTYGPNRDGIMRFLTEVWPQIRMAESDAFLRIAGTLLPKDRSYWEKIKGVELLGFVKDLSQIYKNSSFTVAPIFFGGGTKIKVLESLAYRRTCVVTPHAHYGYEHIFKHQESIIRSESPSDMAQDCIWLLQNPDICKSMGEKGYQIVKKYYSFDRFKEIVVNTVEQVVSHHKGISKRV